MERILIVRLGAMGDVIHALPAVHAIRQAMPHAHIGWAIEERWSELLCARGAGPMDAGTDRQPLINQVHRADTKIWRRKSFSGETLRSVAQFRRTLRAEPYDIAIDLQGSIKSAVIAAISGAKTRMGDAAPRESGAALFYSKTHAANSAHVIDQARELVLAAIGHANSAMTDESERCLIADLIPRDTHAEAWCESELKSMQMGRFALITPGTGWGAKEWPASRYGEVARALSQDGIATVVNIGPSEREKTLGAEVEAASGGGARSISSSVAQLVALTRRAALFVGGDTGPMHLASALGVPVVAIFGPTDPARNGPYYSPSIVLRSKHSLTSYSHRATQDAGIAEIRAEEVIDAVRRLLR